MRLIPTGGAVAFGLLVALAGAAASAEAAPQRSKLDSALRDNASARGLHVIIQTRTGTLDTVASEGRRRGDKIHRFHRLINAVTLTVTGAELSALEQDGSVLTISADAVVRASTHGKPSAFVPDPIQSSTPPAPTTDPTAGSSPSAGGGGTFTVPPQVAAGSSVGVAVIDSGIEPSADLVPFFFKDFVNGIDQPYDDYGHGTHVAGLIAGRGVMSDGAYHGVAPNARLIGLKVLDGHGAGRTSTIIQAIEFAIANRDQLGIDIINLSLGHPVYEPPATDPLVQAVNAAVRAGIVVIASAGNEGKNPNTGNAWYGGVLSPANAPSVVTVGAIDTHGTDAVGDDTIPTYSSRGPARFSGLAKPDIAAPGQGLISLAALNGFLYKSHPDRQVPGRDGVGHYFRLNGTSMAAAVTSGAVALMVQANRDRFTAPLTPNAVKALLEFSAMPLAGADAVTQGRGELNQGAAVALASAIDPSTPTGDWWLTAPIEPFSTLGDESVVWAQSVIWGNRIVWGNTVFINQPAWAASADWGSSDTGDTVVWGNSEGGDDTVVWGNNDEDTVVWGNSDGDTVVWGNEDDDTVVWGNELDDDDTVVWGNSLP
jgi:serine protease AprX